MILNKKIFHRTEFHNCYTFYFIFVDYSSLIENISWLIFSFIKYSCVFYRWQLFSFCDFKQKKSYGKWNKSCKQEEQYKQTLKEFLRSRIIVSFFIFSLRNFTFVIICPHMLLYSPTFILYTHVSVEWNLRNSI